MRVLTHQKFTPIVMKIDVFVVPEDMHLGVRQSLYYIRSKSNIDFFKFSAV